VSLSRDWQLLLSSSHRLPVYSRQVGVWFKMSLLLKWKHQQCCYCCNCCWCSDCGSFYGCYLSGCCCSCVKHVTWLLMFLVISSLLYSITLSAVMLLLSTLCFYYKHLNLITVVFVIFLITCSCKSPASYCHYYTKW